MKDEIKEILEELQEKKELYNNYSENDIIPNEYYKSHILLDYITNLQEEINKLTAESTEWEERTYCWQDHAEDLQITIDKAIKIIERNENKAPIEVVLNDIAKALNILKGEDNE